VSRDSVVVRTGAQVEGTIRESVPFSLRGILGFLGPVGSWLAMTVSLVLLGLLVLWLFPRAISSVVGAGTRRPLASAAWGIGLLLLVPLACVAAMLTLLALPLGVVAALAFIVLLFVGVAWAGSIIGSYVVPDRGRIASFLIGIAILRALALVPYAGGPISLVAAVFGVGAATIAVWGARRRGGKHRVGAVSADGRRAMPIAVPPPSPEPTRDAAPEVMPAPPGEPTREPMPERTGEPASGAVPEVVPINAGAAEAAVLHARDDAVAAERELSPEVPPATDASRAADEVEREPEPALFDDLEVHLPPAVLSPDDGREDDAEETREPAPPA
jgi:hypothetical protein